LIHAAVGCTGVAFPVAAEGLQHNRRAALPRFDSVVLNDYTDGPRGGDTPPRV
jgi:hypothetical protein